LTIVIAPIRQRYASQLGQEVRLNI
jgi:hypothetical protein